jgi:glucose-1-phosphate adenylyltransferase
LEYHIEKKADVTISLIEVPWTEASRFGIMRTNKDYRITEFEEKPRNPKNNLASMGIYIFRWNILKEYLEMDNQNPNSTHDFGKDVIPLLIEEKKKLYAYPFKGYWKDVGTIKSLWEANMDLLKEDCELDLFDNDSKIYTVNLNQPPQYLSSNAIVKESIINEGCIIEGEIENSVLFQGVRGGKGSSIKESVIMPETTIGNNVLIEKAIVLWDTQVPDGTVIRSLDDEIILVTEEMLKSK